MSYEEMSDFEINKLVASHESLIINNLQITSKNPTAVMVNDIVQSFMFDPCNDPSDGWPIIDANRISVVTIGGEWESHWFSDAIKDEAFNTANLNPLRAAMICFLKMKDAENE